MEKHARSGVLRSPGPRRIMWCYILCDVPCSKAGTSNQGSTRKAGCAAAGQRRVLNSSSGRRNHLRQISGVLWSLQDKLHQEFYNVPTKAGHADLSACMQLQGEAGSRIHLPFLKTRMVAARLKRTCPHACSRGSCQTCRTHLLLC